MLISVSAYSRYGRSIAYGCQTRYRANIKVCTANTCSKGGCIMLILTRRVGETLMVGDEVTVSVLGIKGNQVRIGINAPKEVSVHREEIYERIKAEERE